MANELAYIGLRKFRYIVVFKNRQQRPVFNNMVCPQGEICLLGGMFTPTFTPRGEHSLLIKRMEGHTENFTPRGQIHP
jgi:hypothetical protein